MIWDHPSLPYSICPSSLFRSSLVGIPDTNMSCRIDSTQRHIIFVVSKSAKFCKGNCLLVEVVPVLYAILIAVITCDELAARCTRDEGIHSVYHTRLAHTSIHPAATTALAIARWAYWWNEIRLKDACCSKLRALHSGFFLLSFSIVLPFM